VRNGPLQEAGEKNPIKATILVTVLAIVFVLLGDLNQLAILSSMPFLITYAFVNYAYCSLAMSNDLVSINKGDSSAAATYGSNEGGVSSRNPLDGLFTEGQAAELEQNMLGGQAWYSKCINRYVSFATVSLDFSTYRVKVIGTNRTL